MFGFLMMFLMMGLPILLVGGLIAVGYLILDRAGHTLPAQPIYAGHNSTPYVAQMPRANIQVCSHCGAGIQPGWTFCAQCGAPVQPA